MDQVKIGRFIAECRKQNQLTQAELAEQLGITDRAVSKWENGRAMPDSSIMLALCAILKISVTDLLSGEVVTKEQHDEKMEKRLLDAIREKEEANKRLLSMEFVLAILAFVFLFVCNLLAAYLPMPDLLRILMIVGSAILTFACLFYMLRIEQVTGYYECANCHHKYVPTFKSVLMAQHIGRTRKLRCPKCGRKTWNKKTIRGD